MYIFENPFAGILFFVCLPVFLMAQSSGKYKTPGVYIEEVSAFPNSVAQVETAIPAFIGYTERAGDGKTSLKNKPTRITSLIEYEKYFGGAPQTKYTFTEKSQGTFELETASGKYNLYYGLRFFFENGGGSCYIVSVGNYTEPITTDAILGNPTGGLNSLTKEPEPTMIVVPDAVLLDIDGWQIVSQKMIQHCGELQNRVAILDVYDGYKKTMTSATNITEIEEFRNRVSGNSLSYGVAYYPWLNTSIVREVSFLNIANPGEMIEPLSLEAEQNYPTEKSEKIKSEILKLKKEVKVEEADTLHKTLTAISPRYNEIMKELKTQLNLQPPSAGIAGVYTAVDNSRGVWKAPANVSMNSVLSPAVNLTNEEQENLNAPLNGKAINAIRSFPGQGVLVWGARTLDANSNDWRYINVRRTLIMLEQSIKTATKAYVFEPNDANTWTTVRAMITNYLTEKWKQGALASATPNDAFFVNVGLGTTMTQLDILEGRLIVEIGVALTRPAEFIIIRFMQKMAES